MSDFDPKTAPELPGPVSFADLADADLHLVYTDGLVRRIRHDELLAGLRDNALSPQYVTISGDTTLDSTYRGKTLYITADAILTLPVYADEDPSYAFEIMFDGQAAHTVSLATQSTDTVRNGETSIDGDSVVSRTPTAGQWAASGKVSVP